MLCRGVRRLRHLHPELAEGSAYSKRPRVEYVRHFSSGIGQVNGRSASRIQRKKHVYVAVVGLTFAYNRSLDRDDHISGVGDFCANGRHLAMCWVCRWWYCGFCPRTQPISPSPGLFLSAYEYCVVVAPRFTQVSHHLPRCLDYRSVGGAESIKAGPLASASATEVTTYSTLLRLRLKLKLKLKLKHTAVYETKGLLLPNGLAYGYGLG